MMAEDDIVYTTEYDVIVVGTGIVESIVAASLARAGQKVLHLDTNEYYGSDFASLPLHQFEEWMTAQPPPPTSDSPTQPYPYPLTNAFRCTLLHQSKADTFQPRSSSFSLDIQPKMLLSNSPLVDVLVHSGVGRYLDFMAMQGTFMYSAQPQNKNPPIWEVPCSKPDVFKSKLNMLEKRHLMKFLQFVADYGEADVTTLNERDLTASRALKRPQNKQHDDKLTTTFDQYASFTDVLSTHFKLSAALQQVVRYAVLLQPTSPHPSAELSTSDSLDAIFAFVTSIGKFAPSPYLTPMYGISEVAQSFCRLSAVYNGTYILRTSLSHLDVRPSVGDPTSGGHLDVRPPPVDETTSSGHVDVRPSVDGTTSGDLCVGMSTTDGKSFRAKHVVLNASSYAHSIGYTPHTALLRGIFVVDTSIQVGVDRLVLVLPPGEVAHPNGALSGSWAVHVLQMDSTMGVCASGTFLIHVTTVAPLDTPAEDLVSYMHAIYACLYPAKAVTPVWSAVFTIPSSITSPTTTSSLANVHVCPSPPLLDTTLATCVADARAIFRAICPQETLLFLPKSEEAHAEAGTGADSDSDVALLDQAAQLLQTSVTETGKRSIEDYSKGEVAVLSSTSSTSSTVNGSNDSP